MKTLLLLSMIFLASCSTSSNTYLAMMQQSGHYRVNISETEPNTYIVYLNEFTDVWFNSTVKEERIKFIQDLFNDKSTKILSEEIININPVRTYVIKVRSGS